MASPSPKKESILLIEDEPDVRDLVRLHLRQAGFRVLEAGDGLTGLQLAQREHPHAIVLDMMLPEMSGDQVCRKLKSDVSTSEIPLMMLTAKASPEERVAGLELGSDDYLTKPFSPRELVLRLRILLRRSKSREAENTFSAGPVELDRANFQVRLEGEKLDLTGIEFRLLAALMGQSGRALDRDALLHHVWGHRHAGTTRTVDTHVRRLRAKLGVHESCLQTVHGEGYRFIASPEADPQVGQSGMS
jgi:DNA-binding response OmpR family regulator